MKIMIEVSLTRNPINAVVNTVLDGITEEAALSGFSLTAIRLGNTPDLVILDFAPIMGLTLESRPKATADRIKRSILRNERARAIRIDYVSVIAYGQRYDYQIGTNDDTTI